MMRNRWIVVLAQVVVVVTTPAGCGREPIDLSKKVAPSSGDGGADAARLPTRDAGACALDCNALSGRCDEITGKCVECEVDNDCGGKPPHRGSLSLARPRCHPRTKQCVSCLEDDDCLIMAFIRVAEGERWVCDTSTSLCTSSCLQPSSCDVPLPSQVQCNPQTLQCLECITDEGCVLRLDLGEDPSCRNGRCVECQNDDACGGRQCHLPSGRCEGCATDDDCPAGFGCHFITHRCVAAPLSGP